uniref:Orf3 n=1 Tax=Moniliophthora roreri (strain MCA 2997) TaxID=1381753 RepID=F2WVN8_MONRO|nr:orf3 [Moniliophthora roreri]
MISSKYFFKWVKGGIKLSTVCLIILPNLFNSLWVNINLSLYWSWSLTFICSYNGLNMYIPLLSFLIFLPDFIFSLLDSSLFSTLDNIIKFLFSNSLALSLLINSLSKYSAILSAIPILVTL